jgi:hypothetical protein
MAAVLACAWPALLLATACLLPFLNKGFLIDDPEYLGIARQVLKNPLHPMDFLICWNTVDYCMKAYAVTPGNTLMGYALVPTVLGGSAEWMAHVTQLVFAWVAIVAMSSLVLRFGWSRGHAIVGALLLVAIPPFLPMASTAMPDVLATALALVGMERLAAWKAQAKWQQGAAAGIALGLAGIARAHLALLLPLAAFFLLDSVNPREILIQVRRELWRWTPVLAGGLVLFTMIVATRERGLTLNPPPVVLGTGHISHNIRSYLLYFCFPLPLAACWAASRWYTRPRRVAYALVSAAAIAILAPGNRIWALLACFGFCVLADLLFDSWKKRDQQGLFPMLWLLIPLPIVYYIHLPIKYLLPCMPALILICFRLGVFVPARIARAGSVFLIVGATIYSMLILRSDAEFAEFGRVSMDRLIRPRAAAGEKVWYGGDFSAYWYAPLAGAELYVVGTSQPKAGDLLAVGIQEGGAVTLKHFPKRTLVQTLRHRYRFGRTMFVGIGLYTNLTGNWLWGFGDSEDDRYELWRIE